jgi:hypoxanthine-DNA glycosylase
MVMAGAHPGADLPRGPAAAGSGAIHARGLSPVLGRATRVLILGSFPGAASLAAARYYAHPRNQFWRLLGEVLDEPLPALAYDERLHCLARRGIGLWDTIAACARSGSLDAAIRQAQYAEVSAVREMAPALVAVAFNGGTAARRERAWREAGYATLPLPSSSAAHTMPFAAKLSAWRGLARLG